MSDILKKIKQQILTCKELTFSKEDLDKLPKDERVQVEKALLTLIKSGNKESIKYIPYLNIDIEDYLETGDIKSLPVLTQSEIFLNLYRKTKSTFFIDSIIELAKKDLEVYKFLINIFLNHLVDEPLMNNLYEEILSISFSNKTYQDIYEDEENEINKNIPKVSAINAIIGFAIGDALGVPVEFSTREERKKHPITEMLGYKAHYVPAGTWSDDTSMTLACLDSIIEKQDINYDDIMNKFCDWLRKAKYTATNIVFDIGTCTSLALANYTKGISALNCGISSQNSNGNGSLMRMIPITYYLWINSLTDKEETEIINNYSGLTHAHEISKLGCKIYCDYLKQLLLDKSKEEAYEYIKSKDYEKSYSKETVTLYSRILKDNIKELPEEEISSSGYVLSTLEASLWCTLNSNSYEEAVEKAINLGKDTDTIGAITGSLNGVIYGINNIPDRWKTTLLKRDYLEDKSKEFTITLKNIKSKIKEKSLYRNYLDRMTNDSFHANYRDDFSQTNSI